MDTFCSNTNMNHLLPYSAPTWASKLRFLPQFYVKLAQRETPIQEWNLPKVKEGFKVSIKRDDMTGSILAGNKIRKLEFLLADALSQKCDSVITCGGIQSNHCRATSLASKLVGLKCHLLLRTTQAEEDKKLCTANVLLDRLSAAKIYLVPNESLEEGLSARIDNLAERLCIVNIYLMYSLYSQKFSTKIRKLEFLLADALSQKCDSVITCGGIQSNHCRATSLASKLVGLKCHLLLRTTQAEEDQKLCTANVLLDRLSAAKIYLVPSESLKEGFSARIDNLAERLWKEKGEKAYHVPLGGSSPVGTFGYIEAFQEMINQGVLQNFDDVIMAAGSGGAVGGFAIANYLTGSKLKVHGVSMRHDPNYFYDHIDQLINDYELKNIKARDICDIIDGYKGIGCAKSTDQEVEQLIEIAQSTGVVLDPVYTLKAAIGMLQEIENNPSRFKGKRILFIHTGGFYAVYDGRINNLLTSGDKTQNKEFVVWNDASKSPL